MSIPTLETPRLLLRAHRLSDLPEYAAMWADPIVIRHTIGQAQTSEESWGRYLRAQGHWAVMGYGYWAVEEKASNCLIGEVGFADLHREITPSLNNMPEAGWILHPDFHGQGYAGEAVSAMHDWGKTHFGPVRTCCIISPENEASIRVAERAGYREIAHTVYRDTPVIVFFRDL